MWYRMFSLSCIFVVNAGAFGDILIVRALLCVPILPKLPPDNISENIPDHHCHVQKVERHQLLQIYKSLSKFKLTSLVVATTVTGYFMAPGVVNPSVLACTILGTGLTSCAANTLNQFLEIPYDSQMARTKNRVLVRGLISPLHAVLFAGATGVAGVTTLALGTNGLTAALGLANLVLYAGVYTPLKRCSIVNTWVGAVVGSIPPLMGWAACTNSIMDPGALLFGAILFSWQFPHFNALSWNLRGDYSKAGYRMMAVTHPELCRRVAAKHTALLTLMTSAAPLTGMVPWDFLFLALPFNFLFSMGSIKFYDDPSAGTSRELFHLSLIYLLAIVSLMVACAKLPPLHRKLKAHFYQNPADAVV
ncbi:COX10 [Cordylochernes scorpioides]|uniref:Protoheme IX farnesyltransferase, mitochondrial n=1 Tax=Cordylochernes scorpioides TaxID=51811 RepID=A0ABY6LL80_9ARAC|nr:COX10 [Cordylochernes scorpioides]